MDRGGPFTGDGAPEDAGDEDAAPRGWLPPDDRLWRHPSELGKVDDDPVDLSTLSLDDLGPVVGDGHRLPWPSRPGLAARGRPAATRRPAAVVGAAAVVLAVVLVVMVADRSVHAPTRQANVLAANDTSLTTAVAPAPRLRAMVQEVRRSLVGLIVGPQHGTRSLVTGVATGDGLVITAATAVGRTTQVTALLPDGRRVGATVLGVDSHSGVAVVAVAQPVPPASFAGRDLAPGDLAMTECLCDHVPASGASSAPAAAVALATVEAVGTPGTGTVPGTAQPLLDVIQADHVPMPQQAWGGVLVDGAGQVAGILDSQATTSGERMDVFVPGWLARRVAEQLATEHRVDHGWLGITGASAPGSCGGAAVRSVIADAPAAAVLAPGEVVVGVDGNRICTWAELQAATYVVPPGHTVDLQVRGTGGTRTVAVALSASPG